MAAITKEEYFTMLKAAVELTATSNNMALRDKLYELSQRLGEKLFK